MEQPSRFASSSNGVNDARDEALRRSRELVRHCSGCIRAIHRQEWSRVDRLLAEMHTAAADLRGCVADHGELYYAGYTQDALKEVVEAAITVALVRGYELPTAAELQVEPATYLKGMAEAATELRRFILDLMRREERHTVQAEQLLSAMDAIYDQLVTFDFPDAVTYGLRRQTDIVRGVLERTRGDLTSAMRQQQLQDALRRFEQETATRHG